jgi:hypothetical protein
MFFMKVALMDGWMAAIPGSGPRRRARIRPRYIQQWSLHPEFRTKNAKTQTPSSRLHNISICVTSDGTLYAELHPMQQPPTGVQPHN